MQAAPVIKSRPVYTPVSLLPQAQFHLFVCQAAGLEELRLLARQALARSSELLVFGQPGEADIESEKLTDTSQMTAVISRVLVQAPLASAIYVAGTEAFLWQVRNMARKFGFADEQIRLCAPADNMRRVFCTHCYSVMEGIGYSPVTCVGCQRSLLVRDHFSRFLGAYVGVQVNAESPSEQPATEELC